jgi:hypothetical protein
MKLYPKQLNSIEALERERRRLKREIASTDPTDFFSRGAGGGKKQKKEKAHKSAEPEGDGNSFFITIIDLLTSKGVADGALSIIDPLMTLLGRKAGKSIIKPLAKELLGGYVKWKIIEISYKTALRFIRSKQHKHQAKKD